MRLQNNADSSNIIQRLKQYIIIKTTLCNWSDDVSQYGTTKDVNTHLQHPNPRMVNSPIHSDILTPTWSVSTSHWHPLNINRQTYFSQVTIFKGAAHAEREEDAQKATVAIYFLEAVWILSIAWLIVCFNLGGKKIGVGETFPCRLIEMGWITKLDICWGEFGCHRNAQGVVTCIPKNNKF